MLSDNISTVNKTKKYFTAISGIIKPRTLNIGTSIKCDRLICPQSQLMVYTSSCYIILAKQQLKVHQGGWNKPSKFASHILQNSEVRKLLYIHSLGRRGEGESALALYIRCGGFGHIFGALKIYTLCIFWVKSSDTHFFFRSLKEYQDLKKKTLVMIAACS